MLPALLAVGIGAIVFRLRRLRGELFALLTLAVTFVIATIILNTPIDGGGGIFMSAVPLPAIVPTPTGTIYVLGFVLCVLTLVIAWKVAHSRLGMGLFAIHDDEDVAEAKGVPTFRYKLAAFALSAGIAGAVGGVHAMYVGFITVAGTFELTVPLYVVLMSVLGGSRSWFGPAIGATVITTLLYAFISGGEAMVGRAIVALILISRSCGCRTASCRRSKKWAGEAPLPRRPMARAEVGTRRPATAKPIGDTVLLQVRGAAKRFGGLQALGGVDLDVARGRDPRPGRAQRLGQDDPDQRHLRLLSADLGLGHGRRRGDRQSAGARDRASRRGAHLPDPAAVREHDVLENVVLAATFGGPAAPGRDPRRGNALDRLHRPRPARRTCCRPA